MLGQIGACLRQSWIVIISVLTDSAGLSGRAFHAPFGGKPLARDTRARSAHREEMPLSNQIEAMHSFGTGRADTSAATDANDTKPSLLRIPASSRRRARRETGNGTVRHRGEPARGRGPRRDEKRLAFSGKHPLHRKVLQWSRGESNPQAPAESPEEYADSDGRAALGAARPAPGAKRDAGRGRTGGPTGGPVPPTSRPNTGGDHAPPEADLARLVAAWANLPPDVRAGIVAVLRKATPAR